MRKDRFIRPFLSLISLALVGLGIVALASVSTIFSFPAFSFPAFSFVEAMASPGLIPVAFSLISMIMMAGVALFFWPKIVSFLDRVQIRRQDRYMFGI